MDAHSDKKRTPVWIKILLALSLALNLAIAGVVAGFILRGGPQGVRGPNMGYAMPYVLALPREARRDLFGTVRRDDSLPDRQDHRADYRAMIEALSAAPFDANAVQSVLERQSEGATRLQSAGQAAWLQVVREFTDEERAAYVTRLEERMNRKGSSNKNEPSKK